MATPINFGNQSVTFIDPQEEERKRRAAAAKARGWDDATIQKFQLIDKVQDQLSRQRAAQASKQQEKPKTGAFRANSLLGFGTSLLPFGEVLRKKLAGEKITGGDVALETALSALPIAGKIVGKGVKAAKGLTKAGKAAKTASKTADVATDVNRERNLLTTLLKGNPDEGFVSGRLTRGGEALKAEARGVKPSIKPLNAADPLYTKGVKEVSETLNTVPRKVTITGRTKYGTKGSATKQLSQVEAAQQSAGAELDDAISKVKTPFKKEQLQVTRDDALKDIVGENGSGVLEMGKKHNSIVTELDNKIANIKDPSGAVALKREVQGKIKFNRGTASPDNTAEKIYEVYRRKLDNLIDDVNPDIKKANTKYSRLQTAKNVVIQNTPGNMKQAGNAGPTSRLLNNSVTQSAADRAGRILTRTGKITAAPLTQQAVVRAPFSVANAFGTGQQGEAQEAPTELFPGTQNPDEAVVNELVAGGVTDPQEMFDALSGQGKYTPEQTAEAENPLGISSAELFQQALQAPDAKQRKELLDFAKVAAEFEKSTKGATGSIKKTETQRARDNAALLTEKAIQQLEAGSVNTGLVSGNLERVKGVVGKADPESLAFNTTISNLKALIAKANAGTSFTAGEKALLNQYAPRVGDSGQVLRAKLSALHDVFSKAQESEYSSGQAGSSLSDFSDDELVQQLVEQRGY